MTRKIGAIVLTYKLGSLSYGDSKLEKWKNFNKKIVWPSSSLQIDFLDAAKNMVPFLAGTNGEYNDS